MLVAGLSACHKLWYLHLAAQNGLVVTAYVDEAEGVMVEDEDGGGHFESVTLRPHVTLASGDEAAAQALHHEANALCFLARSMNFPVHHEPVIRLADDPLGE